MGPLGGVKRRTGRTLPIDSGPQGEEGELSVDPVCSWLLPSLPSQSDECPRQPIPRAFWPFEPMSVLAVRWRVAANRASQPSDRAVRPSNLRAPGPLDQMSVPAIRSDESPGHASARPNRASERPIETWTDLERRCGPCPGRASGFSTNTLCVPSAERRSPDPRSMPWDPLLARLAARNEAAKPPVILSHNLLPFQNLDHS